MSNKYGQLSHEERHVLSNYLKDGLSLRKIAIKLNRSVSTLSYEIKTNSPNGDRKEYQPNTASFNVRLRKWNANSKNPAKNNDTWKFVLEKLHERWSPQQIAGRLKKIYPHESKKRISHETIYQFINSKEGKALELHKGLRRRKLRKIHGCSPNGHSKRESIPNRIPIKNRPEIVNKKKRYGDWESDLMEGNRNDKASLSVQKERKSQYMCLSKVNDKSTIENISALETTLGKFPKLMLNTLTFDNGRENTNHVKLTQVFGIKTFFCDAYCSWQKGGVENGIGLIRDYLPKGTKLTKIPHLEIKEIQDALNNRPRKTLGYLTPNEVISKHLKKLGVRLPT